MLGALLKQSFGGLDPSEMVDEIKIRLADEVDYDLEATNQKLFADYYRDHPFIRIPAVIDSHSTRRVLTTELADGHRWSEMLDRGSGDPRPGRRDHLPLRVPLAVPVRGVQRRPASRQLPVPRRRDRDVPRLRAGQALHATTSSTMFGSMVEAAAVDHDAVEFRRIVEAAGMLLPDAPVDTDEVGEYFSLFYDTVRNDAEMTWTREYANSVVRHTFDRTSPISQYATVPRAFVFIQRINLGLYALLGELGATGNYRRIAAELWPFVDADRPDRRRASVGRVGSRRWLTPAWGHLTRRS